MEPRRRAPRLARPAGARDIARSDIVAGLVVTAPDATLALLSTRAADATVCPSEVARALAADAGAPDDWRGLMPAVHSAIDALSAERRIRLSWKGKVLARRDGPYRIGQGQDFSDSAESQ